MNIRITAGLTLILSLCGAARLGAQPFDHTHSAYGTLLRAHVVEGRVDYKALKAAPAALNGYLDVLAAVTKADFETWTQSQQLAYYFNLYNAATLKLIVDHYPVKSIKDIGGILSSPWDQRVVRLFGRAITLNNLEHDILRKDYNEPRLHMALVCAAKAARRCEARPITARDWTRSWTIKRVST